jgi:hypothetical protein
MADIDIERLFEEMESRFFGKYRGTVVDNRDPLGGNRLEVRVPGVSGRETKWALPCVPYAAADLGLHAIPPVGASVWIEFEAGELDHPIWVGCFWDEGEQVPGDSPEIVVLKTPGATIKIEDRGTVEIETTGGTKLVMSGNEISLEAPSIRQNANGGTTEVSAAGFDAQNGAFTVI